MRLFVFAHVSVKCWLHDDEPSGLASLSSCQAAFLRAASVLQENGHFGLLATNTIAQGDSARLGLNQLVDDGLSIIRAVSSRPWPGEANLEVA